MSLQNLIIQRDAHALDDTSKQSLQWHGKKITKGAQRCLATGAPKDDQIRFLNLINNEAKVRRSTKALVQGTAKARSYEDLPEARAKRAEKDAAKEANGKGKRGWKRKSAIPEADEAEADEATADKAKRGRKRKSAVPEADAPEPKVKVARISNAPESARGSMAQMSGTQVTPDPQRAPVARMW